jgi:ABC-2 type transport system ATP-binding protein
MRTFSKGMQQRVAIARTLIQDPQVLLFDEPTAALDPEAARSLRDYVRELAASRGRTVLLCTHNLTEAEQLCQRLSIIKGGKQIAEGTPLGLRARFSSTYSLKVYERSPALLERLAELTAIEALRVDGPGTILYRTADPSTANPLVIRTAVAAGADVVGLGETGASLEDVYLKLVKGEGIDGVW